MFLCFVLTSSISIYVSRTSVLSKLSLLVITVYHLQFALSGGRHQVPVNDQHIVGVSNWAARKIGGKLKKITHAEEQVLLVMFD